MLIVLCLLKVSWASWGDCRRSLGLGAVSPFIAYAIGTLRRVLLFYLFCENRKNRKDSNIMKKTVHSALGILFSLHFVVCLVSCGNTVNATGVWEKATYLKNAEFGKGATTVQVEVSAEDQSVTFTMHTDKTTLGDALLEYKLIAGEESAYGLYVKVVNGMTADYDVDQSYWAFYKDGEYLMTGVDGTEISDGEHYELVYTKQ